ncbi:hypothetical protein LENED_000742 [Lentinula edodes]|uniref:Uncharacterized protein n=1 Tax=Lentinula edodes TaxID=5353 RepID=A0A1Q3DX42_LENED|nr:hypothetical protein LENED_000742 [Lentinula edodes]
MSRLASLVIPSPKQNKPVFDFDYQRSRTHANNLSSNCYLHKLNSVNSCELPIFYGSFKLQTTIIHAC